MSPASRAVFVVGAKRTAFGAFGGSLSQHSTTELGVAATKAALAEANIPGDIVDGIVFGNVIQSSPDAAYLARHVGLQSGLSMETPALTINRLCGSGFETVLQGDAAIQLGQADIMICGGAENMSMAPLNVDGNDVRFKGVKLGGGLQLRDSLWDGLTDAHIKTPMGVTAENLATKYGITRQECDEFAIRSQQKWAEANARTEFKNEIAPIEIETRKGTKVVDTDEHPRPESTLEKLSSLPPVFSKTGVVTAANASGICDGAGAIILASEEAVNEHNLTPLARLVSHHVAGCDPSIMGIGPVPAIHAAISKAQWDLSSVDHLEVNEAFAAQCLSVLRELAFTPDEIEAKANIHGGAISMGHPLAASGSRIVAHLVHQLTKQTSPKRVIGSACIGGGQGIAVALEKP